VNATWIAAANHDWIKLSQTRGDLSKDSRIMVSIDWAKAPLGENLLGAIEIKGAAATRIVKVPVFNPDRKVTTGVAGFVETNGVVSIEAEHFTQASHGEVSWQVIPGLGRSVDSVAIFPTTAKSIDPARIDSETPVLQYQVRFLTTGKITTTCYLVPTHPIRAGTGLRYAIAIDDGQPQLVTVGADLQVPSRQWSLNVLSASATGTSSHEIAKAGTHVLKIYMIDAGVVLDKIVIDSGGSRPSYLGPPETKISF